MMSNEVFDGQMLAEKLAKLNNSQQSIESLSRWCITHRKKAKQIVESWDKQLKSSQKDQCVSLLYLANDILQNSRRKGSEFVNEFWKVLPASLKLVYQNGNENGKKAVTRLVDIWEERKVFGSRGQNLKDEMLGKNPPSPSVSNAKSSNLIKIVKRDALSVRFKLAVGGLPEKILTAFQSVLNEHLNEDVSLNKCNSAIHHVSQIEKDVKNTISQGDQPGSILLDELQDQENTIHSCIAQLESTQATRSSLTSLLREALQDQESMLESINTELQIARGQIELASNIRKRLTSVPSPQTMATGLMTEASREIQQNLPSVQINSITPQLPVLHSLASFAPLKITEEENKKAAAAAVAAKLAASASSAQMLTSVLSSLVAEEAASMNGGAKGLSIFPPEKRPKLEKPMSVSEVGSSDMPSSTFISSMPQQPLTSMPLGPPTSNQAQFAPPLPPQPPSLSQATPSVSQYLQSGRMVGATPYGYGSNTLPPPPPLPAHITMGLARPALQPPQQQPLQPSAGGYYRPLGMGFYGQGPQSATPPVPRQRHPLRIKSLKSNADEAILSSVLESCQKLMEAFLAWLHKC